LVLVYYTYISSWTMAFSFYSLFKDYWGRETQELMISYLQSFQGFGAERVHHPITPFVFFTITLAINVWVVSRGISGGIERLAKVGMPTLFLFAIVLAVAVMLQEPVPGGGSPLEGLEFIYRPDLSGLTDASVWL